MITMKFIIKNTLIFIVITIISACSTSGNAEKSPRSPSNDGHRFKDIMITYQENLPLTRNIEISIAGDGNFHALYETLKSYCSQPADKNCWNSDRMTGRIDKEDRAKLLNLASEEKIFSIPNEEDMKPSGGKISISVSTKKIGTKSISISAADLRKHPTIINFRTLLMKLLGLPSSK
ncbi:MAG: hypothetical protein HN337_05590 [Deltaproteobacteria bacterium]|jgi:hypothetical protein|nr:hypothetical protein [Deltaproteobacteria bacterium]